MGLLELIVTIALIGLIVWVITTVVPMPDKFKQIIYIFALVAVVLFSLHALGIFPRFHDVKLK